MPIYFSLISIFLEFFISKHHFYKKSRDALRLIFHSLRSSSLVFGMQGFSFACQDIEERLLNDEDLQTVAKFMQLSKKIYEQELASVIQVLK